MIKLSKLIIALILFVSLCPQGFAEVDWNIQSTLKFDATPLDIALSPDGKSVFVLTDGGDILVYDSGGTLKEKIAVGFHVDQIRIDPRGGQAFCHQSSE